MFTYMYYSNNLHAFIMCICVCVCVCEWRCKKKILFSGDRSRKFYAR